LVVVVVEEQLLGFDAIIAIDKLDYFMLAGGDSY